MNPLLQQFLVSFFRWALTFGSLPLVKLGILKDGSDAEQYIAAGAIALAMFAWSMWAKYKNRIAFITALEAPPGTTEAEVKAIVKEKAKDGGGGPVGVWLVLAALLVAGCITGQRLETGGAYAATDVAKARPELFVVDSSFDLAYAALNATFKYEQSNRRTLWAISPDIKHGLDKLRLDAGEVVYDYALARQVYVTFPSTENLDVLSTVIGRLQAANTAALAVIQSKGQL